MSFRRTVAFWRGMFPVYVEYKWLKYRKAHMDPAVYQATIEAFYERTAVTLVDLMTRLGGIAIKIGQVLATVGHGILPDAIVRHLRVLHAGVPAKSYPEIARIVETSLSGQQQNSPKGRQRMSDVFAWFDEKPLGAASIAQAHLARLKSDPDETVVVKVQYPTVRKQLQADLWNMQLAIRLISPENRDLAAALQERHRRELDFRLEADHLRECAANLQAHGVEPQLVRIPRVRNETGLCGENMLIMEYLQGTSLATILHEEQTRLARALGKESAHEWQEHVTAQLQGGAQSLAADGKTKDRAMTANRSRLPVWVTNPLVQTGGARLLRTYATVRDGVDRVRHDVRRALDPASWSRRSSAERPHRAPPQVNLARVLRTLVHVHGLQMLVDGVYNQDPHPGNVLVLPDGRLGLLDYGMMGRISDADREQAVDTVLALADGDTRRTARVYDRSGYKLKLRTGLCRDEAVLHRIATFHWDRMDLSPLTWSTTGETHHDVLQMLQGVMEPYVPPWIEDGRRLSALLMGPHIQTGRPGFSLAKSWKPIALEAKAQLTKQRQQQQQKQKQ